MEIVIGVVLTLFTLIVVRRHLNPFRTGLLALAAKVAILVGLFVGHMVMLHFGPAIAFAYVAAAVLVGLDLPEVWRELKPDPHAGPARLNTPAGGAVRRDDEDEFARLTAGWDAR